MKTYPAGPFNVAIGTSAASPFEAVATIQPQNSMQPLRTVMAEGATEFEAEAAALKLAQAAAAEMWLDPRYRRYVD